MSYHPLSTWHLVDIIPPMTETESGIALSDNLKRNETCAVVRASGPGAELRGGHRSVQWAQPGDVVLVEPHALWCGPEDGTAFVRDTDLLALMNGEEVVPLNDWVWIDPDPTPLETDGGILLSEEWVRPRGRSGIVRAFGPGQMRTRGPIAGCRKSRSDIMGGVHLAIGTRVWWSRYSDAVAVGRFRCEGVLIRAGLLVAAADTE